jgi:glycogen debranching enzyme
MVAMPGTRPGIMAPYQEHPEAHPLQLKLAYDPKTDSKSYFPLLVALPDGKTNLNGAAIKSLQEEIETENENIAAAYRKTQEHYAHFFDTRLTTETPDPKLDEAIRWAEIAIEQTKVKHNDELGLVAGWYPAWDSTRPGFGWFFGRDTLWSLYAIDSYGDVALARQALEFIARRQRADGKIMHEYAQTAEMVDWPSFPYEYAAADSTPLFLMAIEDYVRTTGDLDFLKSHWEKVKKAYIFERSHDTDGDGVYDNSQGTGWVEAWPPRMPHQEIYLAALDLQSTQSMSRLARLMGDSSLEREAEAQARLIASRLKGYRTASGMYAFSKNQDGSFDPTPTIFASVAWWTRGSGLEDAGAMFADWAGHRFSTDWGTRSVAENASVYDPISYHQGSVWPLFTGWTALSEYRAGRTLSAYSHLMQNADLTWAQDPGFDTEVLSGQFFEPLGRSSSHQLWSSAMVISPAIRGLFGLEVDGLRHIIHLEPHLPASWSTAKLHHVQIGDELVDLAFERKGNTLTVEATSDHDTTLCLNPPEEKACTEKAQAVHRITLPLPPVELGMKYRSPIPGSITRDLKALDEERNPDGVTVKLEAPAGSTRDLYLRNNTKKTVRVEGAEQQGDSLLVHFPEGEGYQTQTVTIRWK